MESTTADIGNVGAALIKANLLYEGVNFTDEFLKNYREPFLAKRRAYGNSDAFRFTFMTIPQELYIGEERLVCGVHARETSGWILDCDLEQRFLLKFGETPICKVDFPKRPGFYDSQLSAGKVGRQVGTLYGGGSLGIFVYGSCALVDAEKPCGYCSIAPNRSQQTDFAEVVRPQDVYELTLAALRDPRSTITQVMINGGNFKDRNKGFTHYTRICEAARRAIDECGRPEVELHLIVFPPENVELVSDLVPLGVCMAMNMEVFDEGIFAEVCPGKEEIGGHKVIFDTLSYAVDRLGAGNVFSIMVGGLEPVSSMSEGFDFLTRLGVVPVVNVFHADPGTPLENHPIPRPELIMEMGRALQNSYRSNSFTRPFYLNCGRNAIDTEAHRGLF
ncbi:radical SAM protein [Agrobacterium pusense]|jgi:hypothetical protein|uniref:radical SAM protein n=1 Tax=Agrobacterium pusense TaxID=648995 RepID=UPI0024529AEB|nr:radical SAM protein [Agrobacterium pusense]